MTPRRSSTAATGQSGEGGRPGARAIVVGLDCITGLQTARILAARGVRVVGVASDRKHFCCRTRVCERILEADTASEQLIEALVAIGPEQRERAVLFPCTDQSVVLLSTHRQRLERWYHLVLPSADVVELLLDKLSFYEYAQAQGLPIPRTAFLRGRGEAEEAARLLRFPAIVKPPRRTPVWEAEMREKVFRVESPSELLTLYDRAAPHAEALIAQEWIAGDERDQYTCNCYFDRESRPLATFVTRKIRQWPPQAGTGSLGEEVRNDDVLRATTALFQRAGFSGLAYLEMKRDSRSGEYLIVEPNVGRPTGRSATAEAGGVELLLTAYCDAVGLPLPESREQRYTGAKWIYWRADIQSAWWHWRRGQLSVRDWRRSIRGRRTDAVLSWRDPAPFVFDVWRTARLLARSPRELAGDGATRAGYEDPA